MKTAYMYGSCFQNDIKRYNESYRVVKIKTPHLTFKGVGDDFCFLQQIKTTLADGSSFGWLGGKRLFGCVPVSLR